MIVALSHGYPPYWNMGGEVSLHRLMAHLPNAACLTDLKGQPPTVHEGVRVEQIAVDDVLDINADIGGVVRQLAAMGATAVIGQNELSLVAVRAARALGIPSYVYVHTPPRFGGNVKQAIAEATYVICNTGAAADQWGTSRDLVLHPIIDFETRFSESIDRSEANLYLSTSSLLNKGIRIILELARKMPRSQFAVVRSPAEATHGLRDLERQAAAIRNLELLPRVAPDEVASAYYSRTRILLVPSHYETYGMSAVEAACYGIPSVHVGNEHVNEGIGAAAELLLNPSVISVREAIARIEANYDERSRAVYSRAVGLFGRQRSEINTIVDHIVSMSGEGVRDESA